jgi:hypothetical protein
MILIAELKEYTATMQAFLPLVNTSHILLNEGEVINFLSAMKKSDNQLMLVIMPDARSRAKDEDNIIMNNSVGFLFLEKTEYSAARKDEWIAIFERTQESALAFTRKIINDKSEGDCSFNRFLDVNNISIEPLTNLASCNGWSVEIFFDTPF